MTRWSTKDPYVVKGRNRSSRALVIQLDQISWIQKYNTHGLHRFRVLLASLGPDKQRPPLSQLPVHFCEQVEVQTSPLQLALDIKRCGLRPVLGIGQQGVHCSRQPEGLMALPSESRGALEDRLSSSHHPHRHGSWRLDPPDFFRQKPRMLATAC